MRTRAVEAEHAFVFVRQGGTGPPVLLLHGFPETHLMWRGIAPLLMPDFTTVLADLPGYGQSACPPDSADHSNMSKRTMAATLVDAMRRLGHETFSVVGHDRGGRVAYRMALDHPSVVTSVAVLDVVPTADVWERADARLMLAFWPFSLLAQPAPLPERLISAMPEAVVDDALGQWGSPSTTFSREVAQAYCDALRDPAHVHSICEEYRAAASIDRQHDMADAKVGLRIACPLLVLWSSNGGLETWYEESGGPLGLWSRWADNVRGQAVRGGHFFPEEAPRETATLLYDFLHLALAARKE
jgi:haloacetate dehalogenase